MRTLPKWVDKVQDGNKKGQSIYDLSFNPEGTQLIIAAGNHVLVYDTSEGTLIQTLKGHKDKVHCVSYAKNGQKFASGSADKSVIIWSNSLEGLLKYTHSDSLQCLSFNPSTHQLVSCALSDFAFWSTEQKAVQKYKISHKINACSWTTDGQYVALGLHNGVVSIRNRVGDEITMIERPAGPAIWALAWNKNKEDQTELLSVTDWNKTLSFYASDGRLIGKERNLGFEALKATLHPTGEYLLISGLNKACVMYTRDGIRLDLVGEPQNSWVWCCAVHPSGNFFILGCQDGTIAYYQLVFNTIHGLYKERYAFRENMTDVIIQHLVNEQKVRIKCRDLIKKIAIFKHRLAVQLPERVVIYELYSDDENDMHYKAKEKITQKLECSLLVVCTEHLVICMEKKLQSMFFNGQLDKDWNFDSPIRYIKNVGGPPRGEGILLGLKNGQVWEVHLDNAEPVLKVTVKSGVRCLDLSQKKLKLAVVDDTGLLNVFYAETGELYYQEPDVNSVAFNICYEDMIAFSGNDILSIKILDFAAHKEKIAGFVVGFSGCRVFCLCDSAMETTELMMSAPMYQFIEKKLYNDAYLVACLGVTNEDWEELGHAALEQLEFETARLAFMKLQDYFHLELIEDLKAQQSNGDANRDAMIGDIYAHRGKFKEAARCYQKAGMEHKALTMFTENRMFDEAQEYLGSGDHTDLIRQKADWAKTVNEHKAAADMYMSIGDVKSTVDIYAEKGWIDELVELGRKIDKSEKGSLTSIAEHLKRLNQAPFAGEIYRRLGDSASVLSLLVNDKEWQQAFALVQTQPQYKSLVYVPYARWLAENDKFVQAQKAFHRAGKQEEAFKVLLQLTENAIDESRFQDAGYYYWIIAKQFLDLSKDDEQNQNYLLGEFENNSRLAGIYYAYHAIHRYLEEPFTSYMPEALFHISRFLMIETNQNRPKGISSFAILYCLSKQARKLGANKFAKQVLDKIQNLRIPHKFQEQVEIATVAAKARPYSDPEELLPMCYRCSAYNPLGNMMNRCMNCGQKFIHSYVSFEILPLVEFMVQSDINDCEAVRLIETPPEKNENRQATIPEGDEAEEEEEEILRVDFEAEAEDPFTAKFNAYEGGDGTYIPVVVGRETLLSMDPTSVLILKWNAPLRFQYFKNLLPDVQIAMCQHCFKAFHVDDFELQLLQKGYCPFCRTPSSEATANDSLEDEDLL